MKTICYLDCTLVFFIYVYFIYVVTLYLRQTYNHYRSEYFKHRTVLLMSCCSMLLVFPVDIINLFFLQYSPGDAIIRMAYYLTFVAHSLPTLLLICFKPNEDCFNCFNRCTPKRYSIFQFSADDLLNRRLSDDEQTEISRHSLARNLDSFKTNRQSGPALYSPDLMSDSGRLHLRTEIASGSPPDDFLSFEDYIPTRKKYVSATLVEHMIEDNNEELIRTTSTNHYDQSSDEDYDGS